MFCSKCGNKVEEDAVFCGKCGAKVHENFEGQTQMQSLSKVNHETAGGSGTIDGGDSSVDSVEMVVSIEKIEDQGLSKVKFPLFVDGVPLGELSNGQEETYRIQLGDHCIQIGFKGENPVHIWIRATRDSTPIYLNYIWRVKNKRDIICLPPQIVTKPSERGKGSLNVLLSIVCSVLGLAGFILAAFVMPQHSGTIVSAEAHSAAVDVMPFVTGLLIGGFVLVFIGGLAFFLPFLRRRKEFKKELQNRKSRL